MEIRHVHWVLWERARTHGLMCLHKLNPCQDTEYGRVSAHLVAQGYSYYRFESDGIQFVRGEGELMEGCEHVGFVKEGERENLHRQ